MSDELTWFTAPQGPGEFAIAASGTHRAELMPQGPNGVGGWQWYVSEFPRSHLVAHGTARTLAAAKAVAAAALAAAST